VPFFSVKVHGEGVRVPQPDGGAPVVGFYAIRVVWARSEAEAKEKACGLLRDLWAAGSYAQSNEGGAPVLSAESVHAVGVLTWARAPNRGHIFYPEEEHAA
jgi:hypothetical protein